MTFDEQISEILEILNRLGYGAALQEQTEDGYYIWWWDHRSSHYMAHGTFHKGVKYSFGVHGMSFTDYETAFTAFAEYMNWYRKFS